jgi:hypothetical protein
MTALPTWMTDRWQHRADPAPGEGTVYWHMPMHDRPQVINLPATPSSGSPHSPACT